MTDSSKATAGGNADPLFNKYPGIQATPINKELTPNRIRALGPDEIFVFGSNLTGHHGGGAAKLAANKFGAKWGQGPGLQGNSYGIPTMHGGVDVIAPYVDEFISFAKEHPTLTFYVTRIGCGIAGFKEEQIAPLFREALGVANIRLPLSFVNILKDTDPA